MERRDEPGSFYKDARDASTGVPSVGVKVGSSGLLTSHLYQFKAVRFVARCRSPFAPVPKIVLTSRGRCIARPRFRPTAPAVAEPLGSSRAAHVPRPRATVEVCEGYCGE